MKTSFTNNLKKLKKTESLLGLLIVLITTAVYLQTASFDFADFDDDLYVKANPYIQNGLTLEAIKWAVTATYQATWQPLIWMSFMIDFNLFGLAPGGYHITNLIYHLIATVLLYLVMLRSTGAMWKSFFVASVFALHPLHVESVAWIAERKDVLSALFWFLTMFLYLRYIKNRTITNYVFVVLSLCFGLMSKGMLVTLPFVLVLFDYWPLNRFNSTWEGLKSSVLEKLPLFVLITISTLITSSALKSWGALASGDELSLTYKIANAITSYGDYILMSIAPINLAVFYPHPGESISILKVILWAIILLLMTAMVLYKSKSHKYIAVGWFWYLGVLFPAIGIAQVGGQALADRYMYLPIIGIAIIAAWGVEELITKLNKGNLQTIAAVLISLSIIFMSALTHMQTRHWKNGFTLFTRAVEVTEGNYLAHNNLGIAELRRGKYKKAETSFKEAIRLNPGYGEAMNNLGRAFEKQGFMNKATDQYIKTIITAPTAQAHNNLGAMRLRSSRFDEALKEFKTALKLDPTLSDVHYNLGNTYLQTDKPAKALLEYKKYITLHTGLSGLKDAHMNLGFTYYKLGKPILAIREFQLVLKVEPTNEEARRNLEILKKQVSE